MAVIFRKRKSATAWSRNHVWILVQTHSRRRDMFRVVEGCPLHPLLLKRRRLRSGVWLLSDSCFEFELSFRSPVQGSRSKIPHCQRAGVAQKLGRDTISVQALRKERSGEIYASEPQCGRQRRGE